MTSGVSTAQGSDPSPPAFDTAIASALARDPAMGAWMIGSSMPNTIYSWDDFEANVVSGQSRSS